MTEAEVKRKTEEAIEKFLNRDSYLLEANVSERAITHRLAVYLEEQFPSPEWHVDCEYNKNGLDSKMIEMYEWESGEKVGTRRRVFPDIIVHRRNTKNNLLIIEVKKGRNITTRDQFDRFKLRCYKNQSDLGYAVALFLKFTTGKNPQVAIRDWIPSKT